MQNDKSTGIDDLVPNVTIHAHESSEKQEKLTIKPDVEAVKNAIIELVAKYNRVFATIGKIIRRKNSV